MKFDVGDRADSSMVDDRRGAGLSRGALGAGVGGLGVVGTLIYLAIRLLGGDVTVDEPGSATPAPTPAAHAPGAGASPIVSKSCQGVTSGNDQGEFAACVEGNVQAFWSRTLPSLGKSYRAAKLVLFTDRTQSGCGVASAATGPFYCPEDHEVYLDTGFFEQLRGRFHAHGGDFAEAYVIAHEYGHHVQSLLGTERAFEAALARAPAKRNALSVMLELQADCYAGVWGHSAYETGRTSKDEIAQALDAAAAVGDDRIQQEVRGRVNPEKFTHGSAAERQRWFNVGMNGGDANACDTFGGALD
jgi:uncharacterized protein